MIRIMLCTEDHQLRHSVDRAELGHLLADPQNLLWLDLEGPAPDELRLLADEFGFHPLAIEDATQHHQRPKIDQYGDYYFLVVYDIDYVAEGDRLDEHELDIFLGRNYLITVHDEPIAEVAEVAERFRRNIAQIERGVGVLLYSLLDTIVDHYFPVIERLGERIEALEAAIYEQRRPGGTRDIFALKRELMDLRRTISPQRDVVAVLARRELPIVGEAVGVYFQDIYDHTIRVTDTIDVYRDLLGGVLDAYHSVTANGLGEVMRVLTAYSIILMSATLVAGIYGMNFDPGASPLSMPELRWRYGYVGSLAAMLLLGLALRQLFRRKGYLA